MAQEPFVLGPSNLFGQFTFLNAGLFPNANLPRIFEPQRSINGVSQITNESLIEQQLGVEFGPAQAAALGHFYALTFNLLQASSQLSDLTGVPTPLNTNPAHSSFTTVYNQRSVSDSHPNVLSAQVIDNATLTTYAIQVNSPGTPTATYSVNNSANVPLVGNTFTLDAGRLTVRVLTSSTGSATIAVEPNVQALASAIAGFTQAFNDELAFLTKNQQFVTSDVQDTLLKAVQPRLNALSQLGITQVQQVPQALDATHALEQAVGLPTSQPQTVVGSLQVDQTKLTTALQTMSEAAIQDVFGGLQGVATAVGQEANTVITSPPGEFSTTPPSFVNRSSIFSFFRGSAGAGLFAALSSALQRPQDSGLLVNVLT